MSGLDVGPLREQLRPARRDRSAGKLANGTNGRRTPKSAVPSPRPSTSTQRSYSSPASVAHARVKAAAATPTQTPRTQTASPVTSQSRTTERLSRSRSMGAPSTTSREDLGFGRAGRSRSRGATTGPTLVTPAKREDRQQRRSAQLRRKLHEVICELEELDKASSGSKRSHLCGWQIAVKEANTQSQHYHGLLVEALEETRVLRVALSQSDAENTRLQKEASILGSGRERSPPSQAACSKNGLREIELMDIRAELACAARERDSYRMRYEAVVSAEATSPRHATPIVRDGLKRIELEARCATLEQMAKAHEITRGQLILPNTVRSILAEHDLPSGLQESVMRAVHEHLNEREHPQRASPGVPTDTPNSHATHPSPLSSALKGSRASKRANDSSVSPASQSQASDVTPPTRRKL